MTSLRLIVINTCFAALVVYAWLLGYVQWVLAADTSHISYVIIAVFLAALASSFVRVVKVDRLVRDAATAHLQWNRRSVRKRASKAPAMNNHLNELAKWLAMLGMFGTVVGLIQMAFSLQHGSIGSADNIGAALSQAFEGYGVALVTTAVGLVTGGWIEVNALLIGTATECLIRDTAND